MRRLPLLAIAAAVLALPAAASAAPPAGAAYVRDCNAAVDFNLKISSSRNMTCGAARTEMRRHRRSISRRFSTPGGFVCTRVSGGPLSGQWRCAKGRRAFRFEFSD